MSKIKSLLLATLFAALPLVAQAETLPCTIGPDDECPEYDPQVIVPGSGSTLT